MAVGEGQASEDSSLSRRDDVPAKWLRMSVRDERAVTLVELIIAIVILGILFSAVAGALINFSQIALNNERRVQATGFMSSEHENLQTIPWDLAVLYEDEVTAMPAVEGLDLTALEFEGEPLVLIPGPDGGRNDLVPEPHAVVDDEYEVFTFVTQSDIATAKRFTTIVKWTVLGREVTQRFISLRAPTLANLAVGGLPEVLLFDVSPTTVPLTPLDETLGVTERSVSVVAVFSRGVNVASIEYEEADTGAIVTHLLEEDPASQTPSGEFTRWTGELPELSGPFIDDGENREQSLLLRGTTVLGDEATRKRDLLFSSDFGGATPVIDSVSDSPGTVIVHDDPERRLCEDVVVSATVSGLDEAAGRVHMSWVADDGERGTTLDLVGEHSGAEDLYRHTFHEGAKSPWDPEGPGSGPAIDVKFNITAENVGDVASGITSSDGVSVRRQAGGGC